jgi:hypothetical protein
VPRFVAVHGAVFTNRFLFQRATKKPIKRIENEITTLSTYRILVEWKRLQLRLISRNVNTVSIMLLRAIHRCKL